MSKERELLERSIELIDQYWDDSKVGYPRDADNRKLFYEIEELLAQPEQEPVAYVADPSVGFDVSRSPQGMPLVWLGKLEYGDKLYRVGKDNE